MKMLRKKPGLVKHVVHCEESWAHWVGVQRDSDNQGPGHAEAQAACRELGGVTCKGNQHMEWHREAVVHHVHLLMIRYPEGQRQHSMCLELLMAEHRA